MNAVPHPTNLRSCGSTIYWATELFETTRNDSKNLHHTRKHEGKTRDQQPHGNNITFLLKALYLWV